MLHNFQDTPDNLCQCTLHAESTNHFLLRCPNYNLYRHEMFQIINPILMAKNMYPLTESKLMHILLYGHEEYQFLENKTILNAVVNFIAKTSRFSES